MDNSLRRDLGVFGATMLGLGSMVGTGVFVSISVAAGITGPAVILAVLLAAGVACCNALSSAQLAAAHPVSGGTYEYGYEYLTPLAGFAAGWMFLVAKSASAATAALGIGGYLVTALFPEAGTDRSLIAVLVVVVLTVVVLAGIRRTAVVNSVIVSVTLLSLLFFVALATSEFDPDRFSPFFRPELGRRALPALLYAAALSFVAYTGYGRIATLGEEVRDPKRTIPLAIVTTLVVTLIIYVLVVAAGIGLVGSDGLSLAVERTGAPLEVAAAGVAGVTGRAVLAVGAVAALVGVLLNLILGLSRVVVAMARRGDMPAILKKTTKEQNPAAAIVAVALLISLLTLIGSIRLAWSFSAVTVLTYYALTNAAALMLPGEQRRFPRWVSWIGLIGCMSLGAFVDVQVLIWAATVAAVGLVWYLVARKVNP